MNFVYGHWTYIESSIRFDEIRLEHQRVEGEFVKPGWYWVVLGDWETLQ